MCASTGAHLSFCERFYNEAEPNFGKGEVPIVKVTESRADQGRQGQERVRLHFEIMRWIERPAAIIEALAKLKAAARSGQDAGGAPDAGDDFDDDARRAQG